MVRLGKLVRESCKLTFTDGASISVFFLFEGKVMEEYEAASSDSDDANDSGYESGVLIDPETGLLIDVATGTVVDPPTPDAEELSYTSMKYP